MTTVRKTIALTTQQDALIAAQDETDDTNDSEAIRDPIRHEQERNDGLEAVRAALIGGEQSGEPEPFDFARFKQRKSVQYG